MAFLPQEFEMAQLAAPVYSSWPDDRITVFDPVLLAHGEVETRQEETPANAFAESYRRSVIAWLSVLSENRRFSSQTHWILPHSVLVRDITGDILATQPRDDPSRSDTQALNAVSDRVAVHLCSQGMLEAADDWQMTAIATLRLPQQNASKELATHERILLQLVNQITHGSSETYASRTFTACLSMFLHQSGANLQEKESWLELAKHWQGEGETKG